MAAGEGFKTFTSGEVLTAADVNGYLMQGINVFTNAANRDAEITSPQEGQFAYLKDTNVTTYYTGSAWVGIGASPLTTKGDVYTYSTTDARLAVGANDTVLTADSSTATGLKWSSPASTSITWTARYGHNTTLYQIAYNGTNLYVGVGSNALLFTSTDGITWTARTSGFGANDIFSVAYGNGLFVAVGGNGTITTSTDGITWTARTSNMGSNQINHVVYANSIWVAVGRGGGGTNTGGIIYSTDGLTWTRKSQSLTVGDTYAMVSWNGTNFVIGANNSTNNYLYASTPSGTWTAGADGSGGNLYYIIWDGTRHIVIPSGGVARYSTSTTLGTTTEMSNINTLQANSENSAKSFNCYYDGKIYSSVTAGNGGTNSDWSTTPLQTNYGSTGTKYLAPGGVARTTSRILFVGSTGQILSDGYVLYTSF
jgi:hypothetical protein